MNIHMHKNLLSEDYNLLKMLLNYVIIKSPDKPKPKPRPKPKLKKEK